LGCYYNTKPCHSVSKLPTWREPLIPPAGLLGNAQPKKIILNSFEDRKPTVLPDRQTDRELIYIVSPVKVCRSDLES